MEKIKLEDLIAKKISKESEKIKEIEIKSLNKSISLEKLSLRKIGEIMQEASEQNDLIETYTNLAFYSIPLLREKEVQSEFELDYPKQIVEKIFNFKELTEIAIAILKFNNIELESFEEEIGEKIKKQ